MADDGSLNKILILFVSCPHPVSSSLLLSCMMDDEVVVANTAHVLAPAFSPDASSCILSTFICANICRTKDSLSD